MYLSPRSHRPRGLFAAGDLFYPFDNTLLTVINYLPCASVQRPLRFLRATDGTDKLRAQRFRPLAGDQTDAARSGMKQEGFVGFHFIGFAQQVKTVNPLRKEAAACSKEMASGKIAALSAGTLWTEL